MCLTTAETGHRKTFPSWFRMKSFVCHLNTKLNDTWLFGDIRLSVLLIRGFI